MRGRRYLSVSRSYDCPVLVNMSLIALVDVTGGCVAAPCSRIPKRSGDGGRRCTHTACFTHLLSLLARWCSDCCEPQSRGTSSRVYVGSLPEDVRADEVKELFSKFGTIRDVDIKVPRMPGEPHGCKCRRAGRTVSARSLSRPHYHRLCNVDTSSRVTRCRGSTGTLVLGSLPSGRLLPWVLPPVWAVLFCVRCRHPSCTTRRCVAAAHALHSLFVSLPRG